MVGLLKRSRTAMLLGLLIGPAAPAFAADRPPQQILADLNAVKAPPYDAGRLSDPTYRGQIEQAMQAAAARRDALILELFQADPNFKDLPALMQERWRRIPPIGPGEAKLNKELDDVLARTQNEKLKAEAYFARAQIGLVKSQQSGNLDLSGVEEFIRKEPKDERAPLLLYMGTLVTRDEKAKESLQNRIVKEYPNSQVTATIRAAMRKREALGKPLELAFTDAITGAKVSMAQLKGKVVVLDFWATWCGPCVAEMPNMKGLYARYHPKGVEFIGVSLDQEGPEGLQSLKDFVQKNEIRWPQFYQGKPGAREFAQSWGIEVIPTVFLVDREGKLASTEARGQLEQMIPQLLGEKAPPARTPAASGVGR